MSHKTTREFMRQNGWTYRMMVGGSDHYFMNVRTGASKLVGKYLAITVDDDPGTAPGDLVHPVVLWVHEEPIDEEEHKDALSEHEFPNVKAAVAEVRRLGARP